MRKLQLNIEELVVETFCVRDGGEPGWGTVEARQQNTYTCVTCGGEECDTGGTAGDSDIYHCPDTHAAWDFGTCVPGSCLDSCDSFCAWGPSCDGGTCYDGCGV